MFRGSPTDSAQDARLQRLLGMVKEEFFAVDQTGAGLDFATIEQLAPTKPVARWHACSASKPRLESPSPPSTSNPVPVAARPGQN